MPYGSSTSIVDRRQETNRQRFVGHRKPWLTSQLLRLQRRFTSWVQTRWVAIAATAILMAIAGAGTWAWQSPLLKIRNIEIVGAVSTRESDINERIELWDKRLFTADLQATIDSIAELPLIASVAIERLWPGGVRITVQERQPWGSWEQAGLSYTIDQDGYVLGHGSPPAGSTTIVSNESFSLRPGDRVDHHAVDAAAKITNEIHLALETRAIELTYSPGEGIRVRTADGQTALLGDSSGITYKLAVWARVVEEATERNITYSTIDLRFGNRPVLR
tara:strand:+ start:899 stop:1726 length:828 start_codon:yes stop_codon:yes gene_type:complete